MANNDIVTHLDQFATLATRLDFLNVAALPLACHPCHVDHVKKVSDLENCPINQAFAGIRSCLRWISIAIEEGHLEPSQPLVGRATGWPLRKVCIKSLWIDFSCWFRKQNISKNEMPDQWAFYELLDQLFIRVDNKYEIPMLEHCREAFAILRMKYECD